MKPQRPEGCRHPRAELGRTTSWSGKSLCVYGPENEIAAVTFFAKATSAKLEEKKVTFFAKNDAASTKSNTLASVTEWQDSGEHGC